MKKIKHILIVCCVIAAVSCDVISDGKRIVEMDTVVPQKKVLLLDFTDQLCVNCPAATLIVDSLHHYYKEAFVSVTIHTYPTTPTNMQNLLTEEGKEYAKKFGIDGHPSAIIDGFGYFPADLWHGEVLKRFNVQQQINLKLTTNYAPENKQIDIVSDFFDVLLSADLKYQLWLVEDSIVEWQKFGAGKNDIDYNYVHNHVFRSSVNGFSGENLTLGKGTTTLHHTFTVDNEKWNAAHLSVVGFIFNASTNEVYEVKQSHLYKN